MLIVKADHQEPLVVVRLSLAAEIAKQGKRMMSTREKIGSSRLLPGEVHDFVQKCGGALKPVGGSMS